MGETIQDLLEEILSRLDGRRVVVHGAGRTDAGVHALGQVASFMLQREMPELELLRALNGNLGPEVCVREVSFVDPRFHARLSAKAKTYRYVLYLGDVVSPFLHRYVYHCHYRLNIERMRAVAPLFVGQHDFSLLCSKSRPWGSPVREVTELKLIEQDEWLEMQITANGFLRSMARRIAGTLEEVGRGRLSAGEVERLLRGERAVQAGPALPAKGLTLLRVDY
jgi:tRNA pseudouridine38-40 synthase